MPITLKGLWDKRIESLKNLFDVSKEVISFLGAHLDKAYTIKEISKALGLREDWISQAVGMLEVLHIVDKVELKGRNYFYLRRNATDTADVEVTLYEKYPLTIDAETIERRRTLTEKLKTNTITLPELDELIRILTLEGEIAEREGNFGAVVSILLLKTLAEAKRDELTKGGEE